MPVMKLFADRAKSLEFLGRARSQLKSIWLVFAGILVFGLLMLKSLDAVFPLALPDNEDLFAQVVVDEHGLPMRAFPDDQGVWRYQVALDDLSPLYIETLLTYEDQRFWHHPGVDPIALVRSAFLNVYHGKLISGGSTLSMQVARLLHPHSKTLHGKLYQMLRAFQLEWHLSKKDILTLYCNIAPFGGTIEGVQAASYSYLNKPASNLTHAEAALLAVLPQSPTRFRPDLHPQRAEQARNKVLQRMVTLNKWPQALVDSAKLEKVYAKRISSPQLAPLLSRRLTRASNASVIRTTINSDMQRSMSDYVHSFISTQPEFTSAAVLMLDNHTHQIKAYVGTADFGNAKRFGHVDMTQAIRSPGSTLKPFLYAMALDEGLIHSHSLLSDTPRSWQAYRPENFSGNFSGPVSASDALQRSLNVPAVDLLDRLTPQLFNDRLSNAGLTLSVPGDKPNLSLILGGAGASLESLVSTYASFATGGMAVTPQMLKSESNSLNKRYLMSPEAAWVVYKMLSGVGRPGALNNINSIWQPRSLAWKTGTSYGHRDAWAIGFDQKYTIGVWVGRPDGTPVPGATGRDSAGVLLHAIAAQFGVGANEIKQPAKVEQTDICWPLGLEKTRTQDQHCHQTHEAWVINRTVPPTLVDRAAPTLVNPLTVGHQSVALWPASLNPWLPNKWRSSYLISGLTAEQVLPYLPRDFVIQQPLNNAVVTLSGNQDSSPNLTLKTQGLGGDIHWYLNGEYVITKPIDAVASMTLSKRGQNQIVAIDDIGNTDKATVHWVSH